MRSKVPPQKIANPRSEPGYPSWTAMGFQGRCWMIWGAWWISVINFKRWWCNWFELPIYLPYRIVLRVIENWRTGENAFLSPFPLLSDKKRRQPKWYQVPESDPCHPGVLKLSLLEIQNFKSSKTMITFPEKNFKHLKIRNFFKQVKLSSKYFLNSFFEFCSIFLNGVSRLKIPHFVR